MNTHVFPLETARHELFWPSFHRHYGVPSHFPDPLRLNGRQRRELDSLPPQARADGLLELAREDFKQRLGMIGMFDSLSGACHERAWQEWQFAYVAAAVAGWMESEQ